MLKEFLDFVGQGWVGSTLGIFGIVLAVWFYFKSIKSPKATVHIESTRMVGWGGGADLPPGISVSYKDVNVPRISRVLIRLWNAGSATLESNLVPDAEPLRLELSSKDSRILSGVVLKQTMPANQFRVELDQNNPSVLLIKFSYIDPGEGVLLGLLHTDELSAPVFKGVVKGQRISILDSNRLKQSGFARFLKKRLSSRMFGISFLLVGSAFVLAALVVPDETLRAILHFEKIEDPSKRTAMDRVLFGVMGTSYIFLAAVGLWNQRRRFPKELEIKAETGDKRSPSSKH